MKKYLNLLLASMAIVPIASQTVNFVNSENYQVKQTKESLQTKQEWENYAKIDGPNGVNWNALSDITNRGLDRMVNKQANGLKLSKRAIQAVKNSIHDNITKFQKRKLTLQQANDALKNSSDNMTNAIQHPEQGYTNIDDKITAQFFGNQNVDLQLDGLQTYQTAINHLQAKIDQLYPNSHWKLELHDQNQANQTLFDDSNQTNITRFVDNKNSMMVDAQWGNNKSQTFYFQLANVMLNPTLDHEQLFDAMMSYFNGSNSFDLNLSVNNTLEQAVTAICQKISARFKINVTTDSNQSNPHDKFAVVLADNPKQTILSTFNLNDIFSQNMYLNLSIFDYYDNQQTQTTIKNYRNGTFNITNVIYDLNVMKETLKSVFSSSVSINHPQTLGVSTDDTFQTVIDKFNEHLNGLYSHDLYTFHSKLTNQADKGTTLSTQYNPTLTNYGFHINADIIFSYKGQDVDLGNFTINLGNVTLMGQCSEDQKEFDNLSKAMKVISNLKILIEVIDASSWLIAVALLACAGIDFGISTAQATAATFIAVTVGAAVLLISLAIISYNNQLSAWQKKFIIDNSIKLFILVVVSAFILELEADDAAIIDADNVIPTGIPAIEADEEAIADLGVFVNIPLD